MKVNVNTCNVEDLLKIPGVGEKTAEKIINTRGESPFTLHSLCDLLRKDPQEIEKVVTFEEVIIQSDRSHDLSDMKSTMDLCDERNAAFSWEETRPKKHVRSYTPADERREAPPASQYDEGCRRRQYSAEFQEDQHSRYFREHQRSGQLHNRDSRRQYGYDSDKSDDEPEHSRKFIQPPKSLIYSGESSWAAFEMKFKRFVREQMFSEKEAKDYLCWVLVDRAADYYTLMMREDRHMPLRQLMKRMEQRFASKHLRETALIRFQNAKQRIEESIEDWAERLHHLALYAFEEDAGAGLSKRDIKQMVLKFCTGCVDREAGLNAANMRPESLDEATTFILQYQFNHAAVYGRKEDRSPEAAVRSVRSRRDYSEERSPPRREYRGRDATPAWSRTERPQNPRESWGERRDYSPRQDRQSPQERREETPPGRSREAEPDQLQLKNLLGSMMAGLESRLGRMMDDKLSNFASRIEGKVSSLSLRVEKMEDRIDKLEKSRRSPSPKTHSTSPLTCYGCGSSGHFISQCPERGVKSTECAKSRSSIRHPRDDRCRACGKHGRDREHRNRSRSRSRSRSQERARHPRDGRCRAWGKHGRDREESPHERSREGGYRRRHRQEGHPYDERSRAYGVRGSPVYGEPRHPRERSREGGNGEAPKKPPREVS
ncbi:hypothetical protein PoB_001446200 [Plakobranchus ocellatus]|uniref:CCHC-type domain-containing protein n=1 Tax=Plakobranchus ocellatus TaxID=259542 RepID=A0AAV3Z0A2_9GAST|nr:hypothetical protein PoB_001446200 [Plakobranchus ocellatus]